VQATVFGEGNAADVAWVLGVPFQGHGYAVEAASGMVAWLREQGVAEVRAHIHPDHAASARVAERIGLAATGELDGEGEQVWRADLAGLAGLAGLSERTEANR
jgi:RimJ/RimL family protein N-acetyltransferase